MCFYAVTRAANNQGEALILEAKILKLVNTELARHHRTLRFVSIIPDTETQHRVRLEYLVGNSPGKIYLSLYPRSKRTAEVTEEPLV